MASTVNLGMRRRTSLIFCRYFVYSGLGMVRDTSKELCFTHRAHGFSFEGFFGRWNFLGITFDKGLNLLETWEYSARYYARLISSQALYLNLLALHIFKPTL